MPALELFQRFCCFGITAVIFSGLLYRRKNFHLSGRMVVSGTLFRLLLASFYMLPVDRRVFPVNHSYVGVQRFCSSCVFRSRRSACFSAKHYSCIGPRITSKAVFHIAVTVFRFPRCYRCSDSADTPISWLLNVKRVDCADCPDWDDRKGNTEASCSCDVASAEP